MSGAKEIKGKIGSIKNTQKITSAMEMVAASKMKKAQDRMASSRPYAETMRKVIGHIAHGSLEYRHPYLEEREVKRVGYVVISSDRGLCGGLNANEFKAVAKDAEKYIEAGVEVDFAAIGTKAVGFFNRFGGKVVAAKSGLGDNSQRLKPWFSFPNKLKRNHLFFGHWAALNGLFDQPQVTGLDTGCVWGGPLTMQHIESGKRYQAKL